MDIKDVNVLVRTKDETIAVQKRFLSFCNDWVRGGREVFPEYTDCLIKIYPGTNDICTSATIAEGRVLLTAAEFLEQFPEITPELIQRYQQYPIAFCKEVIHFEPTAQQEQIMRAMAAKPKAWVSVKTGHLTGTTAAIACLALWYVSVFDDVAIPIVSTNLEQLRCSTWKEINKWHAGMQEPFKSAIDIQADNLKVIIKGRSDFLIQARVAKEENPDAFQGFHQKNLLYIAQRASEIPDVIFQVAMGAMSTDNSKFLIISKPTRAEGYFHDTFSSDEWNNITLSSKDSPFISKEFITQMKDAFSENFYRVRVLGEFPVEKKLYTVTVDVLQAHGTQTFEVIAESEDDAIDKISHMTDETIQFVGDEIDIDETGKLYVTGCEELT